MDEVLCKWVSKDMKTRNKTYWEVGVPNELPEEDDLWLCEPGLFHYCKHPLIAVMFKEFHNCDFYTKLYKVVPEGRIIEGIDKCGATKLTLVEQLEIPKVTLKQRVAFAILCTLEVYKGASFIRWANNWLSEHDYPEHKSHKDNDLFVPDGDDSELNAAAYTANAAAYYSHYCHETIEKFRVSYETFCASYSCESVIDAQLFANNNNKTIDLFSMMNEAMKVQ